MKHFPSAINFCVLLSSVWESNWRCPIRKLITLMIRSCGLTQRSESFRIHSDCSLTDLIIWGRFSLNGNGIHYNRKQQLVICGKIAVFTYHHLILAFILLLSINDGVHVFLHCDTALVACKRLTLLQVKTIVSKQWEIARDIARCFRYLF